MSLRELHLDLTFKRVEVGALAGSAADLELDGQPTLTQGGIQFKSLCYSKMNLRLLRNDSKTFSTCVNLQSAFLDLHRVPWTLQLFFWSVQ